jgi:hypothetical protein
MGMKVGYAEAAACKVYEEGSEWENRRGHQHEVKVFKFFSPCVWLR